METDDGAGAGSAQTPDGGTSRLPFIVAAVVALALLAGAAFWGWQQREDAGDVRVELAETQSELDELASEESEGRQQAVDGSEAATSPASEAAGGQPRPKKSRSKCKPGTYKVAFQGPLSGDFGGLGQGMANGVKLALSRANAGNIILPGGGALPKGVSLKFKPLDTQGDPGQAPEVAQTARGDRRLVAIVGPSFSGEVEVTGPLYDEAGVPFITATATSPSLIENGWRNFFRLAGHDRQQGIAAAGFLVNELGARKVVTVDDGGDYGRTMVGAVAKSLQKRGATVVEELDLQAGQSSYQDVAREVKAAKADAVYFGGYYGEAGILHRDLGRAGVDVPFVSDDGAFDNAFFENGSSGRDAYALYPGMDVYDAPYEFAQAYEGKFQTPPGAFSAENYIITTLIIDAIAESGCGRRAIRGHLSDFSGEVLDKPIAFDKTGQLVNPRFTAYEGRSKGWYVHSTVTPKD